MSLKGTFRGHHGKGSAEAETSDFEAAVIVAAAVTCRSEDAPEEEPF